MGYSARYHATSLIAVFLALAIGILIGAEFGGAALNNTRKDLEHSLIGNLQDARSRADQLSGELGRANDFAERVYPVLVHDRLAGERIGIVALGGLPGNVSSAIETALGPTGARLVGVGVVREPVDLRSLAGDLAKTRFAEIRRNPETETTLGSRHRAPAGARWHPGGTGSQLLLLQSQRQLRGARWGDRGPRSARRHGAGAARRGSAAGGRR